MQHIIVLMQQYALLAVFVNVLLAESGLPVPAYPTVITASAVAAESGGDSAIELILGGMLAAMIADIGWFAAGRRYGNRVLAVLCRLSLSPDSCVRQTQTVFGRVGPWSLVFAKFVPGLSNIAVALASVTGTRLPIFLVLDGLGAILFVTVPVVLGMIFRDAVADVLETLIELGRMGGAIVVAALLLFLLRRWWQRWRFLQQLRMDRITVPELRALMDAGDTPLILDVRAAAARLKDGIIPGALPAHPEEIDPIVASYDRDTEIIVYCACPNEASAALAAKHLKRAGFRKIRPLLGGIDAWVLAGYALERTETAQVAA
jgi:membrane protein DedA with SNARE-associated domain/rhodanese-related sulfurtransferase